MKYTKPELTIKRILTADTMTASPLSTVEEVDNVDVTANSFFGTFSS